MENLQDERTSRSYSLLRAQTTNRLALWKPWAGADDSHSVELQQFPAVEKVFRAHGVQQREKHEVLEGTKLQGTKLAGYCGVLRQLFAFPALLTFASSLETQFKGKIPNCRFNG